MSTIAQSPYTPGGIPSQRALAVLNDFAMPGCEGWRGGADMQLTQRPVGSDTAAQGEEVMK